MGVVPLKTTFCFVLIRAVRLNQPTNEQNDGQKEANGLCSTVGNCSSLISHVKPFSVWGAKSQTCDNSIFSLQTT